MLGRQQNEGWEGAQTGAQAETSHKISDAKRVDQVA